MAFEYEALVGHLYVVGGRAVSVSPPGALVEVAPRKAARGRETDTFFALVLPCGDAIAPTAFYERMAQLAAERYFDSTGSVTAGIRQMYTLLNQNLLEHNQDPKNRTYEANMICAVLRGSDLIIGRVGAAVAALRHENTISTLPADLTSDEALFDPPLGVQATPEIRMTRHSIGEGSRMVFFDANVADLPQELVYRALAETDIAMLLIAYKELARLQLTLLAVEFVAATTPAPLPVPEGESTVALAAAARASATPPSADATARPGEKRRRQRPPSKAAIQAQRGVGAAARTLAGGLEITQKTIDHYFDERPKAPPAPTDPDGTALPDGDEAPPPDPQTERRPRLSFRLAASTAIFIPIIVVSAVVMLWLSSAGQSEFEICMREANNLAGVARSVPSSSPDNLLATWSAVLSASRQCNQIRPDDPTILALIREGQEVIDRINIIQRREARVMESLPGAVFSRIIVQGTDVYVLDSARNAVYHALLASDGRSFAQRLEPILDMRQGATVQGFPIDSLIDITFSQNLDLIYALDRQGVLITCRRRQKQGCEAQRLLRYEDWVTPASITVWGNEDRFYVLDPGGNQIWRYDRLGGAYSGVPTPYFDGQNRGAITNGVDFAIGRPPGGNVFVLRADGTMLQYFRAQVQEFRLVGFPQGQQPTSAQSMYLDEDPLGQAIYITSRNNGTIYRMTQGGAHWATYRVFNEDLFATLAGVVANPGQDVMYAISGNTIFLIDM